MSTNTAQAEWDRLRRVRMHRPGFETLAGIIDPNPNLFLREFSLPSAQREHDALAQVLRSEGIEVRSLAADLDSSGALDELVSESVTVETDSMPSDRANPLVERIRSDQIDTLPAETKLQLVASNATITRIGQAQTDGGAAALENGSRGLGNERLDRSRLQFDEPVSNLYFQRDQQILTDEGPVVCNVRNQTRVPETAIVEAAWGDEAIHTVSQGSLEGGDYIPAGEFGLIGVSARRTDGSEQVIRTSRAAAIELLEAGAVGHEEVALVHAPLEAEQREHERHHDGPAEHLMNIMHLDTWFNIAGDGLAVGRRALVEAAPVEVFVREGDSYRKERECSFASYLDEKGFDLIEVPYEERLVATNFLTIDDRRVVPIYLPDEDGAYDPTRNRTIERLRATGVEVVPDGEGVQLEALRSGYGGVHCMTCPLERV